MSLILLIGSEHEVNALRSRDLASRSSDARPASLCFVDVVLLICPTSVQFDFF